MADRTLILLAASLLRVPARRLRALALGDDGALRDWIANESATRLAEARRDARGALARLEEVGARVIALDAPAYPAGLRDLADPPAWLAVRGTLPDTSMAPAGTAIVGTRAPTDAARRFARDVAAVVRAPVVSGLARGIDAAAHAGALDAGAATYAYIGSGIDVVYPPEHTELADRVVAAGGALLTESLPGEPVTRWSLVRRDRLQAAHAASIVLVQSELDGGAMHAMRAARTLGRPRYALAPGDDPAFAGNVQAIAEGAETLSWDVARARFAIGPRTPREERFRAP